MNDAYLSQDVLEGNTAQDGGIYTPEWRALTRAMTFAERGFVSIPQHIVAAQKKRISELPSKLVEELLS